MAKKIGMGAKKPAPLSNKATDEALDAFDAQQRVSAETVVEPLKDREHRDLPDGTAGTSTQSDRKTHRSAEKANSSVKVTGISLPAEQLLLLQAVAAARKVEMGGRASVSAVLSELIAQHEDDLIRRAGDKLDAIRALNS